MEKKNLEILNIVIGHYEDSINSIGNLLGPLIGTHRELLSNNKELESVLLGIMRISLKSFGVIRDLKKSIDSINDKE